jgi:hypothetical protein
MAFPAFGQEPKCGDDRGDYANDSECDGRRFAGEGMAASLDRSSVGRDATDCRAGYESGRLFLGDEAAAKAATSCDAIRWGDDSSEHSGGGVCDDPRFEGPAAANLLSDADSGRDAADCRSLCAYGLIHLRDY